MGIATGMVENGWLRIKALSFIIIYIDLMRNHPFLTLLMAISGHCCIDNQNIYNISNNLCLSCVRDDMLNF